MMAVKEKGGRQWWRKLSILLAMIFMCCGLAMPSGFAASEPKAEVVNQEKKPVPTLTLTLLDADGVPISGVSLNAITADFTGRSKGSATTDKNGKAVFKNLKSGTYYFYANFNAIRSHAGYGLPAMIREFKSSRTFYLSESRQFDLGADVETTYTVKRGAYMLFETYLQTVRLGKIIIMNEKNGIEQIIPIASTDYLQIYLPMRTLYKIVTIKDNDYDSWIMEFYAHERLRIELL